MGACLFLSSSIFLRTPFGELVRALALSLILVLKRSHSIRKKYPTWKYVQVLLSYKSNQQPSRNKKIRPFPPCPNPWNYQPQRPTDPEFNMLYSLIAMVFVGSTCGATLSLPLIPTWMASLVGAATLALATTMDSPRGDLARTMGMRLVALIQELWNIQATLGIIPKAAIVSSQIIDKCMILDNQHKVKDKFLRLVNAGYEQILQTADRVQQGPPVVQRGKNERKLKNNDPDDPSSVHRQQRSDRDDQRRRREPMGPIDLDYETDDRRYRRGEAYDDVTSPPPRYLDDIDDRKRERRDDDLTTEQREENEAHEPKKKRGWFGR